MSYHPLYQSSFEIHWHGMYQRGTSHADSVALISQSPIQPGKSISCQFKVYHTVKSIHRCINKVSISGIKKSTEYFRKPLRTLIANVEYTPHGGGL